MIRYNKDIMSVSIHVPAKGTTVDEVNANNIETRFNPRSREGNDSTSHFMIMPIYSFNPRSREGNDKTGHRDNYTRACFNPRSREGNDDLWDFLGYYA